MKRSSVIFGTFLAALVLATPGAAALDLAPLAHATIDSDAEAEYVAVSAFGDARCSTEFCIAVSGTGDAGQRDEWGRCRGGVSASVEGDACSFWAASSGFGTASAGWAPASVFGKCAPYSSSNAPRECFDILGSGDGQGYWLSVSDSDSSDARWVAVSGNGDSNANSVAISGSGESTGWAAVSGTGDSTGSTAAVSGDGRADCWYSFGCWLTASGVSDANCQSGSVVSGVRFCLAFAPLGDADASGDGSIPFSLVGYCNGVRCFAVDPLGPAESYWVGASGTGDASGIVAFSVFGEANGTVALSLKDVLCDPDTVCVEP